MLVVFSQGVLRLCSVELSRTIFDLVKMTSRYYFPAADRISKITRSDKPILFQ
ncbi:hypothetical protein [Psychroflexus aestuariivivens]|uniref:hypothetical protein n=1 Tax=Psychroflexus aestuariivivens TaxID=1795040 RepID=UPI001300A5FC|nr:hypothetical protein [Psychroflexus aestuariivivens]